MDVIKVDDLKAVAALLDISEEQVLVEEWDKLTMWYTLSFVLLQLSWKTSG